MNIKAKNISFDIGSKKILNDINIDVSKKEFIGIIGPNGSGKSTFLKCIYRNLKPTKGVISLDDVDIRDLPIKETSKKIGVVSQHNSYNFDFTVEDIVLMGRAPHKKMMERDNMNDYNIVDEALRKVNMIDFKKRNFSTLSGGEQQRIILARALAQETKCLVLDEPTNHLDIKYQLQLMHIVKHLNIEVIAAIHDLNIAAMYCDKIYVLKDGEIVAYGEPRNILTPELIKEVYEVEATVINNETNNSINISYKCCI